MDTLLRWPPGGSQSEAGPDGAEDAWRRSRCLQADDGRDDPFGAAIRATLMPMTITDPRQPDNPIVFVNNAFLELSGYKREDLLGRNCRLMQGPDTDPAAVARIRAAIEGIYDTNVDILNYRKDGSAFWNALYISPVVDASGALQYFFASQLDVTDRKVGATSGDCTRDHLEAMVQQRTQVLGDTVRELRDTNKKLEDALEARTMMLHEIDHRVKNNLQMVSSLIVLQSRAIRDVTIQNALMEMLSRIEALGSVHRRLYQSDDLTTFDIGQCVHDLVTDLTRVGAHGNVTTTLNLEAVMIPAVQGAPIALLVNELVTNVLKHAFPDQRQGTLAVTVRADENTLRLEVADNGVGRNATRHSRKSLGSSLVVTLCRQLRTEPVWCDSDTGTRITIEIPRTV